MKFLIVNEGSRGEVDSYVGNLRNLDELVDSYVSDRENLLSKEDGNEDYVNEFMEMEFGGISEKCFVEISFGEEDSYKVFIIQDGKIDSSEYQLEGFIDYGEEEMINNPESFRYEYSLFSNDNLVDRV